MQFVPYRSYRIETELGRRECEQRLQAVIAPNPFIARRKKGASLVGDCDGDRFSVQPVMAGQSMFMPQLHGRLDTKDEHTELCVESTPGWATQALMLVVSAMSTVLIFSDRPSVFVLAVGSVILCWFLAMVGFWIDGDRSRQLLAKSLDESPRHSEPMKGSNP